MPIRIFSFLIERCRLRNTWVASRRLIAKKVCKEGQIVFIAVDHWHQQDAEHSNKLVKNNFHKVNQLQLQHIDKQHQNDSESVAIKFTKSNYNMLINSTKVFKCNGSKVNPFYQLRGNKWHQDIQGSLLLTSYNCYMMVVAQWKRKV